MRSTLPARRGNHAALAGDGSPNVFGDEAVAPLIAGAYARGMADTLESMGVAAVMLDRAGTALFVSPAAASLLECGPLRVKARHLVAETAEDNRALGRFLARLLEGHGDAQAMVTLEDAALTLRRMPVARGLSQPGQVLRAVILIDPAQRF